jgi:hypothetical protein
MCWCPGVLLLQRPVSEEPFPIKGWVGADPKKEVALFLVNNTTKVKKYMLFSFTTITILLLSSGLIIVVQHYYLVHIVGRVTSSTVL